MYGTGQVRAMGLSRVKGPKESVMTLVVAFGALAEVGPGPAVQTLNSIRRLRRLISRGFPYVTCSLSGIPRVGSRWRRYFGGCG